MENKKDVRGWKPLLDLVFKEPKNKTAEQIDVYELAERLMASQNIEASVWLIKEFASQERTKGITEGFNAAREMEQVSWLDYKRKYDTLTDYLNSKNHE